MTIKITPTTTSPATIERTCGGRSAAWDFFVPATAGAMICFSTARVSQTGHEISPRPAWSSKSPDEPNQPSNSWAFSQMSA